MTTSPPTSLSEAEVTVEMRRLNSRAGCLRRWGKFEEEAEAIAEARRLKAVRARLRADRELREAGVRLEDYVSGVDS